MASTMPLRHELKFYINEMQYYLLSRALDRVLDRDPNGDENNEYHIRSLYFDTVFNDALYDKLDGVQNRDKYRIRIYNLSDRVIKMECKTKVGSLTAAQVTEIAKTKLPDLNVNSLEAAESQVRGTCRSMGITVVD